MTDEKKPSQAPTPATATGEPHCTLRILGVQGSKHDCRNVRGRNGLRSAMKRHGRRLWAPRCGGHAGRAHALRMESAWQLTRKWLRTASSIEAALQDLPRQLCMNSGHRDRMPFDFGHLDAVRMVLDAKDWRA